MLHERGGAMCGQKKGSRSVVKYDEDRRTVRLNYLALLLMRVVRMSRRIVGDGRSTRRSRLLVYGLEGGWLDAFAVSFGVVSWLACAKLM